MAGGPRDRVVLEEDVAVAYLVQGEGASERAERQGETSLAELCTEFERRCFAQKPWGLGLAPPDLFVRDVYQRNGVFVFLVEQLPGFRTLQWITDDSPMPYGPGAIYRDVHISLPWQYFFVAVTTHGLLLYASVYFLNNRLGSLDEPLCDPHFYNCMPNAHGVYSWICAQGLPASVKSGQSFMEFAGYVIDHFWWGGFNRSAEPSFYSENSERIPDQRMRTITTWEEAARIDPDFALSVPWIKAPRTARQVREELTVGKPSSPMTVSDLTSIVLSPQHSPRGSL